MEDIFKSENNFYLNCDSSRISKFLSHAKLYEMSLGLPGHFAEVGVFRGASFSRARKLGKLFHPDHARKFIGFDVFGKFPQPKYEADRSFIEDQWKDYGDMGISKDVLLETLKRQGLADNVMLIEGNVLETLPEFMKQHEDMSFSIVNIDVDLYEGTKVAIEQLFPRVVRGGVIMLDDYEGFPGARRAVNEYLQEHGRKEVIRKFPFALSPCYLIKE